MSQSPVLNRFITEDQQQRLAHYPPGTVLSTADPGSAMTCPSHSCTSVLRWLLVLLVAAGAAPPVLGIINPFLQPVDVANIHRVVLILEVTAVDQAKQEVVAKVKAVTKGLFAPTEVRISATGQADEAIFSLGPGRTLVAFIGKIRKGGEEELICYAGAGSWYLGKMLDLASPGAWHWDTVGGANECGGIFNGSVERLAELMADLKDGRDFFPARPWIRFRLEKELGAFPHGARGVALVDLDGDGRLDAIATSPDGVRAWLQGEKLSFTDATAQVGLAGIAAARSVAAADVDGSGQTALLLDGVLWMKSGKVFTAGTRVPIIAELISATFADVDSDGWPDVLAATATGVRVFLNPGKPGAPFIDASGKLGLAKAENGAGLAGLAALAQDWDGHGASALYLGARKPLLLQRGKDGAFQPLAIPALECAPSDDGLPTGGAVFGALWRQDPLALLVPRHSGFALLVPEPGRILDYIGSCNETSEPAFRQLWTLAEDFNADGEVDIYTASGAPDIADVCHLNRGYGSYMRPMKQDSSVFPEAGYGSGSWGMAAGDVDGDGAVDLLLGGCDGKVRLLLNESLTLRQDLEESAGVYLVKMAKARLVAVDLAQGRGAIGASLRLTDQQGRLVARRESGGNGVAGSWSSGPVCLAIRQPGDYTLTVRWSDGELSTRTLKVEERQPLLTRITVERPKPKP